MSKLWGGRFEGENDQLFARFNESLSFDMRLWRADITGSLAYSEGLKQAGVLSEEEASTIQDGLRSIFTDLESNPTLLDEGVHQGVEDIHSFVEGELVRRIGDVGGKLHAGRSRNDQVATDLRLLTRDAIRSLQDLTREVQQALINLAENNMDVAIPGYTHLQKAQPVLFAHHMLAYVEMLERDLERLEDAYRRTNRLPLGSGAMAGTNYPIDREFLAKELGFDSITINSMDGVSDRDYVSDVLHACSLIMMHLSRLSEDLIVFASSEFGFIEMGDAVSTGSSIMPQKKNPDALELIRGKTGRVYGNLHSLLTTLKGLPLCYNKDMQEDKEPLFDTLDTVSDSLAVTAIVLRNTSVHKERCLHAASRDYLNATELADYLVRKGIPFRQAHGVAGRCVLHAVQNQLQLEELTMETYQSFSPQIEDDVYQALSLSSALAGKNVPGGTAPNQVQQALATAKARLNRS